MTATTLKKRLERVPDRRLPVFYFVFAHLCLLAAFLAFALVPRALAGFFYHPKMLAVVHLVTLGWITSSILGALYMILPLVLRTPLPGRRLDRWVFWCFVIGVLGMVSHFWIDESSGMVWSAAMVVGALVVVGWRVSRRLALRRAPREHRLPFYLAFVNIALAGLLGTVIGLDKSTDFLPGYVLDHVAAHAHLAALGWATFMVMGAGYRLLPMFLPSALPRGPGLLAEAAVTEVGLLGLVVALYFGADWAPIPGLLFVAGVLLFLRRIRWMLANRRPSPPGLLRPDLAFAHVTLALICLVAAASLGVFLLLGPESPWQPRLVMAYGILGLIGFLAQMVVGISVRLLPLYAWMRQFSAMAFSELPPSPHDLPLRGLQWIVLALWVVGLPVLTAGLVLDSVPAIRLAGAVLAASIVMSSIQLTLLLRHHATTAIEIR